MVGDGQNLNRVSDLTIDDPEFESVQGDLADVWGSDNLEPARRLNSLTDGTQSRLVIAAAKTGALLFVISDLSFMLQCRFWMEPIGHFRRA